jgi:hypothetical protein
MGVALITLTRRRTPMSLEVDPRLVGIDGGLSKEATHGSVNNAFGASCGKEPPEST